MKFRAGIGQDSHRFLPDGANKKCIIAGLVFEDAPGMDADSDGDVVFHAICNAITSLTHVPILGRIAIDLCHKQGITDSRVYLEKALATLDGQKIEHIALTIEGKRPKFQKRSEEIRQNVAEVVKLELDQVGITFTSGDGLTSFGKGEGLMCYAVVTTFQ
ncbi:2-C-methyl-D-erythritol 2,4-cyclodiphosphate synthase [Simkania negevensis]|uniref:2-C-methyl-D-erythritol 2,4-cyclodiphosphate synthase n=1 Tax=Simkania negevensis (strain ATCC VR-1471 / DSM 27360 / Z) TaxID=331113 RepID=F8L441_SIMNZ|nr:2-C-methyl-D-erythritol 2,4-cyclodiphosphate synthase [Simkania negevensis]CCB90075.1 2-C-methyl-D-erythritol 2,4-cyclodiphosphate synthase [Simkania negevensis Z]